MGTLRLQRPAIRSCLTKYRSGNIGTHQVTPMHRATSAQSLKQTIAQDQQTMPQRGGHSGHLGIGPIFYFFLAFF